MDGLRCLFLRYYAGVPPLTHYLRCLPTLVLRCYWVRYIRVTLSLFVTHDLTTIRRYYHISRDDTFGDVDSIVLFFTLTTPPHSTSMERSAVDRSPFDLRWAVIDSWLVLWWWPVAVTTLQFLRSQYIVFTILFPVRQLVTALPVYALHTGAWMVTVPVTPHHHTLHVYLCVPGFPPQFLPPPASAPHTIRYHTSLQFCVCSPTPRSFWVTLPTRSVYLFYLTTFLSLPRLFGFGSTRGFVTTLRTHSSPHHLFTFLHVLPVTFTVYHAPLPARTSLRVPHIPIPTVRASRTLRLPFGLHGSFPHHHHCTYAHSLPIWPLPHLPLRYPIPTTRIPVTTRLPPTITPHWFTCWLHSRFTLPQSLRFTCDYTFTHRWLIWFHHVGDYRWSLVVTDDCRFTIYVTMRRLPFTLGPLHLLTLLLLRSCNLISRTDLRWWRNCYSIPLIYSVRRTVMLVLLLITLLWYSVLLFWYYVIVIPLVSIDYIVDDPDTLLLVFIVVNPVIPGSDIVNLFDGIVLVFDILIRHWLICYWYWWYWWLMTLMTCWWYSIDASTLLLLLWPGIQHSVIDYCPIVLIWRCSRQFTLVMILITWSIDIAGDSITIVDDLFDYDLTDGTLFW